MTIPMNEIKNLMKNLQIGQEEAIEVWKADNDLEQNEEQNALDEKAKKIKIQHNATSDNKRKKSDKPRTTKVSDEKKTLFESILTNIDRCEGVDRKNITILKENKLIQVRMGEKIFKIDLIEQRPPKNK